MSAFVPPQGGGGTMPAQGASPTGTPGRKRRTSPAGFADALLSLVPQGKGTDAAKAAAAGKIATPARQAAAVPGKDPGAPFPPIASESKQAADRGPTRTAAPQEKRTEKGKPSEKEIRRKERSGKASRPLSHAADDSPEGNPASMNGPAAAGGSAAAPMPVPAGPARTASAQQGAPAAGSAAQGIVAPGGREAPAAARISADSLPTRASGRVRERKPAPPRGTSEGPPRADAPSGPRANRSDGSVPNRQLSPDRVPSPSGKGDPSPPLPLETGQPSEEVRTEAPSPKRPPAEVPRESTAAPGALPRAARQDPGRSGYRTAGAVPGGFVPGTGSPGKPGTGKAGNGPEEHPRKEAEQASAEAADAPARRTGKTIPGAEAPLRPAVSGPIVDAPKRAAPDAAQTEDPGKAKPFAGLPSASPVDADTRIRRVVDAPPAAAPPGEPSTPAPLFQQVAMKMTPLPDGAHDVEIRLAPEHLGNLKIELHIDSGRMDASLHADTNEARALLLREEPALREALRNSGMTLSSFHVALSGDSWKERRGAARPDGDGEPPRRRVRKEGPADAVAAVGGREDGRDAPGRTEHWIA